MYTIGDMIDRLTIANIRLWHIEDERRLLEKKSNKNSKDNLQKIRELASKVSKVNKERNILIDQINESIKVISGKKKSLKLTKEQLIGFGKNKSYKTEKT
jgi:hypothetical protein